MNHVWLGMVTALILLNLLAAMTSSMGVAKIALAKPLMLKEAVVNCVGPNG